MNKRRKGGGRTICMQAILATICLLVGCSTVPRGRIDLSRRQFRSLAALSMDPAGFGLEVSTNKHDFLELRGFYKFEPESPGFFVPLSQLTVSARLPASSSQSGKCECEEGSHAG